MSKYFSHITDNTEEENKDKKTSNFSHITDVAEMKQGDFRGETDKPFRQFASDIYTPLAEGLGMIGGGVLGAVGGSPGSPLAAGAAAIALGGAGYAGGKRLAKGLDVLTGLKDSYDDTLQQSMKDIATGAAYEAGGQAVGKAVVGIANKVIAPSTKLIQRAGDQAKEIESIFKEMDVKPTPGQSLPEEGAFSGIEQALGYAPGSSHLMRKRALETIKKMTNISNALFKRGKTEEAEVIGNQIQTYLGKLREGATGKYLKNIDDIEASIKAFKGEGKATIASLKEAQGTALKNIQSETEGLVQGYNKQVKGMSQEASGMTRESLNRGIADDVVNADKLLKEQGDYAYNTFYDSLPGGRAAKITEVVDSGNIYTPSKTRDLGTFQSVREQITSLRKQAANLIGDATDISGKKNDAVRKLYSEADRLESVLDAHIEKNLGEEGKRLYATAKASARAKFDLLYNPKAPIATMKPDQIISRLNRSDQNVIDQLGKLKDAGVDMFPKLKALYRQNILSQAMSKGEPTAQGLRNVLGRMESPKMKAVFEMMTDPIERRNMRLIVNNLTELESQSKTAMEAAKTRFGTQIKEATQATESGLKGLQENLTQAKQLKDKVLNTVDVKFLDNVIGLKTPENIGEYLFSSKGGFGQDTKIRLAKKFLPKEMYDDVLYGYLQKKLAPITDMGHIDMTTLRRLWHKGGISDAMKKALPHEQYNEMRKFFLASRNMNAAFKMAENASQSGSLVIWYNMISKLAAPAGAFAAYSGNRMGQSDNPWISGAGGALVGAGSILMLFNAIGRAYLSKRGSQYLTRAFALPPESPQAIANFYKAIRVTADEEDTKQKKYAEATR